MINQLKGVIEVSNMSNFVFETRRKELYLTSEK